MMESAAPQRTLRHGELLNWYRIERILGRGGFGVIYLARDTNLEHDVAIKEYAPGDIACRREGDSAVLPLTEEHGEAYSRGLERFIREARNLVRFKHPNVVRVMSVFQENNTAYMVMEFEEGVNLRQHFSSRPETREQEALRSLIVPVADGLAEVHRHGFIHRDIKPSNILVRADGSPVLLDFGSARDASTLTNDGLTALVSAGYAPLEQYDGGGGTEGDGQQGPWTDIYALGGVLYHAVSGSDPIDSTRRASALFNGGRDPLLPATLVGKGRYDDAFLRAIDWALAFRVADRPQALGDWMPALLSGTRPASAAPPPPIGSAVDPEAPTVLAAHSLSATAGERTHGQTFARPVPETAAPSRTRPRRARALGLSLAGAATVALVGALVLERDRFAGIGGEAASDPTTTRADGVSEAAAADGAIPGAVESTAAAEVERAAPDGTATGDVRNAGRSKANETAPEEGVERPAAEATVAVRSPSTDAVSAAERVRAAEAKAAEEARVAEAAGRAEAEREAAERKAAEEARAEAVRAAEAEAARRAEAERLAAERQAAEEARAAEEEAARLAEEEAARRAEAERLAAEQAAAREARRVRLDRTLREADAALGAGELERAADALAVADALELPDPRLARLDAALAEAVEARDRPVSDADIEEVVTRFERLRRAIAARDAPAMDRLTEASAQNGLFRRLMADFEELDLELRDIRVRNADRAITATLSIRNMVRANGDRAQPSDAYRDRDIVSTREGSDWSTIRW